MSDLFNKLVLRRKGRHLPHLCLQGLVRECSTVSLIGSPSQVSLEKDLEPVRGLVGPSPECQTPSHLCHPHSSQQETRMRKTGNPRGSLALFLHPAGTAERASWGPQVLLPKEVQEYKCCGSVPSFSSWSAGRVSHLLALLFQATASLDPSLKSFNMVE